MAKKVKRLYEGFQPSSYKLDLKPNAKLKKFSGQIIISGKKTGRPSKRITLHQKDLKIKSTKIIKLGKDSKEIFLSRINTQKSLDELRLHAKEILYPGEYQISIEFNGKITDAMHGLYPCYFEHEGEKKMLLATQFESHHAREAFPCIDEPEAKATFDLTITTPKNLTVLSNTPVKTQEEKSEQLITTFEITPKMSSYLLAFVIGEMHCQEAKTKNGHIVRTWATVAQPKNYMKYANKEAIDILNFFEDYFETPFPLPKIDQVALPDFEIGAMENWGLITYREIALLTDPVNRSLTSEQYVSMVIAHELSHQWFGNLVTMKWWDDLWLNESFASMIEHLALDRLHPDWHQWEQFQTADVLSASNRDMYKDVQALRTGVNHPDEIHSLFDPAIVYAKGARLLKMLYDFIGEESFKKGLKSYFKKFAYKNTTKDDLWAELSASSGQNINKLMDPWLTQSGMPVISVNETSGKLKLSQERFVLDQQKSNNLWPVPLLASETVSPSLLTKKSDVFKTNKPHQIIINSSGSGHYITNYLDPENIRVVSGAISKKTITSQSRINIINDYLLLSRRGDKSLVEALDLVKDCQAEDRDAVWALIARVIGTAKSLSEGNDKTREKIKEFAINLAKENYQKLGWDDKKSDDPNTKLLRLTSVALMVNNEDKQAVKEAIKRFQQAESVAKMPSEYRAILIGCAVKNNIADIKKLIKEYKTTTDSDVQHSIASGLCNIKDVKKAEEILHLALGENGFVRPQDIFRWFAYFMRNRYTRELAWQWLTTSWDRLIELYDGGKSFDHFVVYSAGPINTLEWQKRFIKFFDSKKDITALKRNIKIAESEINARVDWRKRDEPKISKYFLDN